MKKLIAAAGIGAALTIAPLLGAGTASASSGSFLNALNANGWREAYNGDLLNKGYEVCREFGQGYSYADAVNYVYYNTNAVTTWGDSRWFVNTAVNHLCQ